MIPRADGRPPHASDVSAGRPQGARNLASRRPKYHRSATRSGFFNSLLEEFERSSDALIRS
jgi:hypothetical protein